MRPQEVFTSLCHRIDEDMLRIAFYQLKRDAAAGIDKKTWRQYKEALEDNLIDLHTRLVNNTYEAQMSRRVWLEKDDGRKRPIAIAVLEDKIVQRAEVMIYEAIYEQDFLPFSFAFRKGRNQHQALKYLRDQCIENRICWIVELDLKGYFDSIDRKALVEVIKQRVNDGGLLRLLEKHLKAGVVDKGRIEYSDTGVPQGGIISPMISNIFLHHVLDKWFESSVRPKGRCFIVRFADDINIGFELQSDVKLALSLIHKRLTEFKLTINQEKTRTVRFARPAATPQVTKPETFDFLGFTHYWGKTRKGWWTIKRRTAGKRFKRAKKSMWEWLRSNRKKPLPDQHEILCSKLRGHYNYYGVRCNYEMLEYLRRFTLRAWLRWLRRRTSKHGLNWQKFVALMEKFPLPAPRISVSWA